eukprot:TRINITY_DN691_c2_g1_i1.p1 TRINITY_DN691_c2_g1~~TRINITY_DN691_c2_g1_i1.p1  ORF type:complete len:1073 (+),score=364.09 TRINITY_DN691_c2_g1_i1:116-3334(+)
MQQELASLVRDLLTPNNDIRKAAEENFNKAKENPEVLIPGLCGLVSTTQNGEKHMAALLLKKCITDTQNDLYGRLEPATQDKLKEQLLQYLSEVPEKLVRRSIDSSVAALGSVLTEENKWPALLPFLNNMSDKGDEMHVVSVLTIFSSMSSSLEEHANGVGLVIQKSLSKDSLVVKVAAVKAAIAFILSLEDTTNYRSLVPLILSATEASLVDEDSASEILESLIELVETDVEFIVQCGHLPSILHAMTAVASKPDLDSKLQQFAVEFMISFAEADSKAAKKQQFIPNFVKLLVSWLLTESFEDPDEWAKTTEGDQDDEYTNADMGAEGLDRLAIALGGSYMEKHTGNLLLSLVTDADKKADWRCRFAAIKGISHIAEGCRERFEAKLFDLTNLVLSHFTDVHPKVRYTSGRAIAQFCTDFGPGFQANFSERVLQAVAGLLKDPIPRIRHVAASIIVNFCEDAIPETYQSMVKGLLEALYAMLENAQEPMFVKEIALSSIAALAENIGDKFAPYYDTFMPILKAVFHLPECTANNTIKGKAVECASFVAVACGPEKFINSGDCKAILDYMMNITMNLSDDDTRGSYLMQSWVRMATCTQEHFYPYLDVLVEKLLTQCKNNDDVQLLEDDEEVDKNTQCIRLAIKGAGEKKIGIKTSILEEKQLACEMLESYFETFNDKMYKYVEPIWQSAVSPLLQNLYSSGIRETSANLCPLIIKCLKTNVEKGNIPESHVVEMMRVMIPQMVEAMQTEQEVEVAAVLMENFHESLNTYGKPCLPDELLATIPKVVLEVFTESLKNRASLQKDTNEEDDDDEKKKLEEQSSSEEEFLIQSSESVGALIKTHSAFIPHFVQHFLPQVTQMLDRNKFGEVGVKLALCILDDFMEHGKESAMPYFVDILEAIWKCGMMDEEIAQAASYGLTIAAHFVQHISPLPNSPFAMGKLTIEVFLSRSLILLKQVCGKAADEDWAAAVCNAVKALLTIVKLFPNMGGVNEAEIIPAICQILPVGGDLVEAKFVHETIFNMVRDNNPLVVGLNGENLPQIEALADGLMREDEDDCRLSEDTKRLLVEMKRK